MTDARDKHHWRTGWIPQKRAFAFIDRVHRHLSRPRGAIICIGLWESGRLVGVAAVGRPTARLFDDGVKMDVIRCAVRDGVRNGCSRLYATARRLARALNCGLLTYTEEREGGASLRATGAIAETTTSGGDWSREGRSSSSSGGPKIRWRLHALPPSLINETPADRGVNTKAVSP